MSGYGLYIAPTLVIEHCDQKTGHHVCDDPVLMLFHCRQSDVSKRDSQSVKIGLLQKHILQQPLERYILEKTYGSRFSLMFQQT